MRRVLYISSPSTCELCADCVGTSIYSHGAALVQRCWSMNPVSADKRWNLSSVPLSLCPCEILLCAPVTVPCVMSAGFQHFFL